MEETLEKCIPPKSIVLQILQGLATHQANVTGTIYVLWTDMFENKLLVIVIVITTFTTELNY